MIISKLRRPMISISVAIYLCCFLTSPGLAGMLGTVASNLDDGKTRAEELARIQQALETEIVKGKLGAYGFTPEEINQRLEGLSDEQIHLLAQASDDVLAGGGGEGVIIVLLIILIVLVAIYVTGHRVVVK